MTAVDIYRSHVFCNAYCTSFFEKTIDKSASFDIIDSVPNELNIWGYSSAGRALEWHSRGQRFDPAYLHQTKSLETQGLIVIRYYLALRGAENGVTAMVTPFFCVQG